MATAPLLPSGMLPKGFDPFSVQTLDPMPLDNRPTSPTARTVRTVPVDAYGNPAVNAINQNAPSGTSPYYPPEVLALYAYNAAQGAPIGGNTAGTMPGGTPAQSYQSGMLGRGLPSWWDPGMGTMPPEEFDWSTVAPDSATGGPPGLGGLAAALGMGGTPDPGGLAGLMPRPKGWTGPRATGNATYMDRASPGGSSFTQSIGGGSSGTRLTPEEMAARSTAKQAISMLPKRVR